MEPNSAVQQRQRLEALVAIAERLGYQIRYENFGGQGGGLCQFRERKWLFIDVALSTADNLARLESCLGNSIRPS